LKIQIKIKIMDRDRDCKIEHNNPASRMEDQTNIEERDWNHGSRSRIGIAIGDQDHEIEHSNMRSKLENMKESRSRWKE
jgi:hypothetical protein